MLKLTQMNHSLIIYWIVITALQLVAYLIILILIFYQTSFNYIVYFVGEIIEFSKYINFALQSFYAK